MWIFFKWLFLHLKMIKIIGFCFNGWAVEEDWRWNLEMGKKKMWIVCTLRFLRRRSSPVASSEANGGFRRGNNRLRSRWVGRCRGSLGTWAIAGDQNDVVCASRTTPSCTFPRSCSSSLAAPSTPPSAPTSLRFPPPPPAPGTPRPWHRVPPPTPPSGSGSPASPSAGYALRRRCCCRCHRRTWLSGHRENPRTDSRVRFGSGLCLGKPFIVFLFCAMMWVVFIGEFGC